jgi:glycosyltransferase involved in cell wall biosynthesis
VIPKIALVIPCFRVTEHIIEVLDSIDPLVSYIFVIDDGCPDGTGRLIEERIKDERVKVLYHHTNQGVGASVISGYRAALLTDANIIVKLDGDGQMDASNIPSLIQPIVDGSADYTKGDRLDSLVSLIQFPGIRLIGNIALTLLNKISSGYWNVKDPTNGFTAIHVDVLRILPLEMLSKRYFFESDMLFRLNIMRAVVQDVPINAIYGSERSNLSILKSLLSFPFKLFVNFHKRLIYNYYLRDISAASIELLLGIVLWWFGIFFGLSAYVKTMSDGLAATTGTVMISVLPIILGFQLILAFISYDVDNYPKKIKHRREK